MCGCGCVALAAVGKRENPIHRSSNANKNTIKIPSNSLDLDLYSHNNVVHTDTTRTASMIVCNNRPVDDDNNDNDNDYDKKDFNIFCSKQSFRKKPQQQPIIIIIMSVEV